MYESLVEALVDGFTNDINVDIKGISCLKESSEVLTTPTLNLISNNRRANFAADSYSETKLFQFILLVVDQEPLSSPESPAILLERHELRVSLNRLWTVTFHLKKPKGVFFL
jgi:hypothetical protein